MSTVRIMLADTTIGDIPTTAPTVLTIGRILLILLIILFSRSSPFS
jgi:hypothetical protein